MRGKRPLEGWPMEEAIIEALQKGKASFSQSDFLACQEDYDAANYPEASWAPPREEHDGEWRDFESSLEIFRRRPDVAYTPLRERKRHCKK